ncbi:septum site-determining protein MinC [Pseudoluteimonas lycopersici]|uniref:Probable septum site-determining protein MinC n=1 Tax=Pseudoluteimonas lycopersici TaxID=1324796 RepID=A0A516V1Z5_9GAMM|nr:septum site-determining protein MinC [Lysobacter lycopersici]QDQ72535.1 septum site-determining protein MinC [Lysobacter lycopersici]
MAANPNYEQAGELKIGQVGIANLRVRTLDVEKLAEEMRDRVARAPKLFSRAAVIVDFGGLPGTPALADARALVDALRDAGVIPVALAYGSSDNEQLAVQLGLPLLAKFRAQYEPVGGASATTAPAQPAAVEPAPAKPVPATSASNANPGFVQVLPVRSGQQVYADNRDLTVLAAVGAGAEVIADGSIHIYGALRGRALAGAQGFEQARIFCREFRAELVAIAGHYKVLDEIPRELHGKPVQISLHDNELRIDALE